ncbi:MAG: molybdopterin-guanine dinucleotide biosynthesis protein B [Candidatus Methanofastidiosia archaeon]
MGFVGKSKSGKTAAIEKLILEFKMRGYSVAAVKHSHKKLEVNKKGKDSFRLSKAGATPVFLSTPEKTYMTLDEPSSLEEILSKLYGIDYVFVEGFKREKIEKIAFVDSIEELKDLKNVVALISQENLESNIPVFKKKDIKELFDFIEKRRDYLPIICIVGKKGIGKTTLIENLVEIFSRKGLKVGTARHHAHRDFDIDVEGKDSYRHKKAGAFKAAISSPTRIALISDVSKEPSLNELSQLFKECDLVLAEGYSSSKKPRVILAESLEEIEIFGGAEVLAVVSEKKLKTPYEIFSKKKIEGIADLILKRFKFTLE